MHLRGSTYTYRQSLIGSTFLLISHLRRGVVQFLLTHMSAYSKSLHPNIYFNLFKYCTIKTNKYE